MLLNWWTVAGVSIFQRDSDGEHSAAVACIGRRQRAAVLGDDAMRERESDAVTAGLGSEEGNEDLLQLCDGDTRACVSHFDHG